VEVIMSRGLGVLERILFQTIQRHGKPMTFGEIRAEAIGDELDVRLSASFERSIRRALHGMTKKGLLAIGGGGRADPFRYFMDPILIAMASNSAEEGRAWLDALAADPGANEALNKCLAKDGAANTT
jgi:hypothetical protein